MNVVRALRTDAVSLANAEPGPTHTDDEGTFLCDRCCGYCITMLTVHRTRVAAMTRVRDIRHGR